MSISAILLVALISIVFLMAIMWIVSVVLHNASIVDLFWGIGFIITASIYLFLSEGYETRKLIVFGLTAIWGLRLSVHISLRNFGKPEDPRYQDFRKKYGEKRYWWISFFQVFLLQGALIWFISAPLFGVMHFSKTNTIGILDIISILVWITGFLFETIGDYQLKRFKSDKKNQGEVLRTGLWKYTRHPNYFGDSMVWWGFGLFSIASGCYLAIVGPIIMTFLLMQVSGVSLLEKNLKKSKPEYKEYIKQTNAFFPWFPKKK